MRQWISQRENSGVFHQLIRELEVGDVVAYKELFGMTKEQFSFLLGKVSPLIQKKEQPSPINSVQATKQPVECLAVTLWYLAMGETYHSLEYSFRISRQTISSIMSETSRALYKVLAPEYLKVPNSESEWDAVADKFEARWIFPNGIVAIDGKRAIESTLRNTLPQLAALYFVARQVGHECGNMCNKGFQLALQQCCKTS
ncbi:uncharacterized protein LOC111326042 [Stylophora pistillata]|uniref:uncharacterized protein LOC111326042 n=1 Tax=Stylophora pistillata TaxID=50429 RepID=UPI000C03C5DB|nr:uncharacterized protein LOC111326042 [Stylophora pistillata]